MRFVSDENVDRQVVARLREQGHEVLFIAELDPGIEDGEILRRSRTLDAVLITADKDFGDLVFRNRLLHAGVMLIRLEGLSPDEKADRAAAAVQSHGDQLCGRFAVLSKTNLRMRSPLRLSR